MIFFFFAFYVKFNKVLIYFYLDKKTVANFLTVNLFFPQSEIMNGWLIFFFFKLAQFHITFVFIHI